MSVDYKILLWKYLNYVGREESITYWQRERKADGRWSHAIFSEDELCALMEIEKMPMPEWVT